MTYGPCDTCNVDQALTPRVRTIFRARAASVAPAAQPVKSESQEKEKTLGWHDLICEILESLFPYPEAYTVVRSVLDAFEAKLPAPA